MVSDNWFRRSAVIGLMVSVLLLVFAPGASAHSRLTDAEPSSGSTHDEMPGEIVLEFSEDVNRPSHITVHGPDGSLLVEGEAEIDGRFVRADLPDPGLAGTYCVSFRVVSADAHPVTASYEFEVTSGDDTYVDNDGCEESSDSRIRLLIFVIGGFFAVILMALLWNVMRSDPDE